MRALLVFFALISLCSADEPSPLLRYGTPDNQILQPPGDFLVGTPDRTRCPRWTLECLTAESLQGEAKRAADHWAADARVPTEWRASARAYDGFSYDRGHLACAANHVRTPETLAATFTFANTMPQVAVLNRGLWAQLERKIRTQASQPQATAWVITMPVWQPNANGHVHVNTIGDGVWVPTHCGKAVLVDTAGKLSLQCWLLPNATPKDILDGYRVSGDQLEAASGLDIFAGLPDDVEDRLEATKPGK